MKLLAKQGRSVSARHGNLLAIPSGGENGRGDTNFYFVTIIQADRFCRVRRYAGRRNEPAVPDDFAPYDGREQHAEPQIYVA